MIKNEIIIRLLTLVIRQEEEIKQLNDKIDRIKQYIEVYEDYIERNDR